MGRRAMDFEGSPGEAIYKIIKAKGLETQTTPNSNAIYTYWVLPKMPGLTKSSFQHWLKRLQRMGYIRISLIGGGVLASGLDVMVDVKSAQRETEELAIPPDYVYLLKAETGVYKIGISNSPDDRLKQIGLLLPFGVEREHTIPAYHARTLERELHQRFASKRIGKSEWFNLTENDVAYIKSITAYNGGTLDGTP